MKIIQLNTICILIIIYSPLLSISPPKELKGKRDLLGTMTKQKNDLVKVLSQGGSRADLLGPRAGGPERAEISDDMSNNDILSLQQMEMKSIFTFFIRFIIIFF